MLSTSKLEKTQLSEYVFVRGQWGVVACQDNVIKYMVKTFPTTYTVELTL